MKCVPLIHLQETMFQAPLKDAVKHLWHIVHKPGEAGISDALDLLTHATQLEALGQKSTDFERFQFTAEREPQSITFTVSIKDSPVTKQIVVKPTVAELTKIKEKTLSNQSEFFTQNAPLESKHLLADVLLSRNDDGQLQLQGKYLNPSQQARLLGELGNLTPNQQQLFITNQKQELQQWLTFNSNLWGHIADMSEQFITDAGHLLEVAPQDSNSAMEQTMQVIGLIKDISNIQDIYQQSMLGDMLLNSFSRPRLTSQKSWG